MLCEWWKSSVKFPLRLALLIYSLKRPQQSSLITLISFSFYFFLKKCVTPQINFIAISFYYYCYGLQCCKKPNEFAETFVNSSVKEMVKPSHSIFSKTNKLTSRVYRLKSYFLFHLGAYCPILVKKKKIFNYMKLHNSYKYNSWGLYLGQRKTFTVEMWLIPRLWGLKDV